MNADDPWTRYPAPFWLRLLGAAIYLSAYLVITHLLGGHLTAFRVGWAAFMAWPITELTQWWRHRAAR